jgi:3',5'-cyclic AMP phosphodiesterase CpdA
LHRGDLRLVLISDLNGPYGSTSYIDTVHRGVALIPALGPDLVLCAGDMVAGQKRGLGRERLAAMWQAFDRDVLAPLRMGGCPFAPAMGNHDASSARAGGQYVFADDRTEAGRFWQPRRDSLGLELLDGSGFPFHYAIRQGDVVVLVWDASSAAVPAAQLAWAERLLASPAAREARHRLVMGHLPLRAVGEGRDRAGEVLADADAMQALLQRHQVQAYVSGHHHAWFPGRIGDLDLIQLGALGSGPRRLLGQSRPGFQTLTVLDIFTATGQRRETTLDLRSMKPVPRGQLPAQLVDRSGRVQRRRESTHQASEG